MEVDAKGRAGEEWVALVTHHRAQGTAQVPVQFFVNHKILQDVLIVCTGSGMRLHFLKGLMHQSDDFFHIHPVQGVQDILQ